MPSPYSCLLYVKYSSTEVIIMSRCFPLCLTTRNDFSPLGDRPRYLAKDVFYFSQYFCCSDFLNEDGVYSQFFYKVQNTCKHSCAQLWFCETGFLSSSFCSVQSLYLFIFSGKIVLPLFFFQHYILKLPSNSFV